MNTCPGATGWASMKATTTSSLATTLASARSHEISQNKHAADAFSDMSCTLRATTQHAAKHAAFPDVSHIHLLRVRGFVRLGR
jgi:hypothetical protein